MRRALTGPEPRNLFNENFVDGYPRNLSSAKLRRYTVVRQQNFNQSHGDKFSIHDVLQSLDPFPWSSWSLLMALELKNLRITITVHRNNEMIIIWITSDQLCLLSQSDNCFVYYALILDLATDTGNPSG